jgi:hypothetical protein
MPISLSGSLVLTGSLTTTSTITAQTLVVQTITSSISSITGSTNFGTLSSNTHTFTGSLNVSGSTHTILGNVGIGTTSPSQKLEVVGGEIKAGRVDTNQEGGQVSFGRASDNNTTWYIDAYGSSTSPQLRFVDVDNSAVRMVLTGSNVGMGTTSPSYTLDVTGTGRFTSNVGIGAAPQERLTIAGSNGLAGMIRWTDSATASAFLGITSGGVAYIHSNNNTLAFGANGSNNFGETMRLSSGNVGIGTTSPTNKLDVRNSSDFDVKFRSEAAGGTVGLVLETANTFSGTSQAFIKCIGAPGNGNSQLIFGTASGGGDTSGTERMRIAGDGEVYFSSTAGAILFTRPSSGAYHRFLYSGASSNVLYSGGTAIGFNNFADNIRIFNVLDNGNYSFSGSNISDVRLKSNITPITMNAIEKICKLESVSYVMTDNETQIRYGFIAQEVAKILPDLISGEESEGYIGLDYNGILTVAVKAIQELKAENDSLKSRIEILENK